MWQGDHHVSKWMKIGAYHKLVHILSLPHTHAHTRDFSQQRCIKIIIESDRVATEKMGFHLALQRAFWLPTPSKSSIPGKGKWNISPFHNCTQNVMYQGHLIRETVMIMDYIHLYKCQHTRIKRFRFLCLTTFSSYFPLALRESSSTLVWKKHFPASVVKVYIHLIL